MTTLNEGVSQPLTQPEPLFGPGTVGAVDGEAQAGGDEAEWDESRYPGALFNELTANGRTDWTNAW